MSFEGDFQDGSHLMPAPLDLSKSGLRRSPRIAELQNRNPAEQKEETVEGTHIHSASIGRSAAEKDATPNERSTAT